MEFGKIRKLFKAPYRIDQPVADIDHWINRREGIEVDLSPDFQRDHVWTENQEKKFVEWILRGGVSGRDIYWNCPGWMQDFRGPLVLVDGKQRIKAIRRFLAGEITAFGCFIDEYTDQFYLSTGCSLSFHVANLPRKVDVLKWYIDLNSGGTVHDPEEIERVRQLLLEQDDYDQYEHGYTYKESLY